MNKKIGVYICGNVAKKCTGNGCLSSFNERKDAFSDYGLETQLSVFNHCSGCESPLTIDDKINKMKKAGVEVLHISTCIRASCVNYEAIAEAFSKHFEIIGYSHGTKEGLKNNTIIIKS